MQVRFPRFPIQMPRGAAERALFESLEATASDYSSAEDFGRQAARESLQACLKYLHDRGLSGQGLKALADLVRGLDDVDRGILPEIFDPLGGKRAGSEGSKKWSRSTAAQENKRYVAACLGALMHKGTPQKEAARRVARSAQNWPRFGAGIIKLSTVINWRDYILQEQSSNPTRVDYEQLVGMLVDSAEFLEKVLREGPPFSGGTRRTKKT
jgi:hypothetical protein